jgi:chromosomal replication initiator protein
MPPTKFATSFHQTTNSFLLLKENRFAYSAIQELKRSRTALLNQLVFLHGPSGVGKTLLALQFVREQQQARDQRKILRITGGQFAADFAEASQNKTIDRFSAKYREADLLVCEDLGELERRPESQKQITFIIDEILNSGGRLLITCKKMPGELKNMPPRLVNRCHGGLCVAISLPGLSSRESLIRHFAEIQQIPISRDVIQMLAKSSPNSPREILATVIQLETLAQLKQTPIDRRFAQNYLDREVKRKRPALSRISRVVAGHFNVTVADLRSRSRSKGFLLPRQCAIYLSRRLTEESLQKIAEYYGRTHYSTVIHSCKGTIKRLSEEPALRQSISEIYQILGQPNFPEYE